MSCTVKPVPLLAPSPPPSTLRSTPLTPSPLPLTPSGTVLVDFHSDLILVIRETRYLDRMGFHIPEIALNVALQDDKYNTWLEGLNVMLDRFYEVCVWGWGQRRGAGRGRE